MRSADVCATANTGRAHFGHRLAVVGAPPPTSSPRGSHAVVDGERRRPGVAHGARRGRPKVAFLFTGQGAQYAGMARGAVRDEPVFRAALDGAPSCCDAVAGRAAARRAVRRGRAERAALLDETAYTQPALFAVEYALAELWQSWGVEPRRVLGHRVGEYVAACVAGVFALEDGRAAGRGAGPADAGAAGRRGDGGGASRRVAEVEAAGWRRAGRRSSVAAVNGPAHTVVSGPRPAVRRGDGGLRGRRRAGAGR